MLQGPFETHLTVSLPETGGLEELRGFGEARGLKFTWIELASGTVPVQPMLTRHASGALTDERRAIRRIDRELAIRGWKLERVGIEVEADHPAVSAAVDKSLIRSACRYFEHHVKLLLPPGDSPFAASAVRLSQSPSFTKRAADPGGWQ